MTSASLLATGRRLDQALEAHKWIVVATTLGLFLVATGLRAATTPLWFDELFTWHIASQGSLAASWHAMIHGGDPNAPLPYLLVGASQALFGTSELATRLPSILAFGLAAFLLFVVIARRSKVSIALFSICAFCLGPWAGFAFEARSYALQLACCAAAVLSWLFVVEGRRRPLALVGLTTALALGILSHMYGVLLLLPVAIGELTRTVGRRKIDWPVLGALGAACLAGLALIPAAEAAMTYRAAFRTPPSLRGLAGAYYWYFGGWLGAVMVLFSGSLVMLRFRASEDQRVPLDFVGNRDRRHEVACALTLALLPVIQFGGACLVTNAYQPKYVVATAFGVCVILAWMLDRLWIVRPSLVPVAVILALGCLAGQQAMGIAAPRGDDGRHAHGAPAELLHSAQPIVIAAPLLYLPLHHYAPPELRDRINFLVAAPGPAIYDRGVTHGFRSLAELADVVPLGRHDFDSFLGSTGHFLLVGSSKILLARLRANGAEIHPVGSWSWLRTNSSSGRNSHHVLRKAHPVYEVNLRPGGEGELERARQVGQDDGTPPAESAR